MDLAELRGWVEAKREVLQEQGIEAEADFMVRMMIRAKMKGLKVTAEGNVLFMVELMVRKSIAMAGDGVSTEKEREFADTKLANGIRLAKLLGVDSEAIAVATMKATRR
jgi:hypothetical protein